MGKPVFCVDAGTHSERENLRKPPTYIGVLMTLLCMNAGTAISIFSLISGCFYYWSFYVIVKTTPSLFFFFFHGRTPEEVKLEWWGYSLCGVSTYSISGSVLRLSLSRSTTGSPGHLLALSCE